MVGTAMAEWLNGRAVLYDVKPGYCHDRRAVNGCQLAFVCVPTPPGKDGRCDTSLVEDAVDWLEVGLIVICSTVAPGTTDRLKRKTGKRIVFQPEYIGETPQHPFRQIQHCGFIVIGGDPQDTSDLAKFYQERCRPGTRFHFCDALTAELAKYMENAFFAAKVAFCNEFYDIAAAHGVDYQRLRQVWLADPRINGDHTDVYPQDRGFGGKCLPKDLDAIIASARSRGCEPRLLEAIREVNPIFRAGSGRASPSAKAR